MTEVARRPATRRPNEGGLIDGVRAGSIADEIGLRPGDRIIAIGGRVLRDAVDFQFHASDETVELEVVREGIAEIIEIEKPADEDIGVEFQDAAFDGVTTCNNSCFFCFLKGNPKGMRKTLYVKDDDYRLSFFHGNFVTLTNLSDDDWSRLEEQRLSPLNVSVHATDPEMRRYLLGNMTAPEIVPQLRRLGAMGIETNTQIVLCPGVNDGTALDRTIEDLAALYPSVRTISVVPVGATTVAEERIERGTHAEEVHGCTPQYARDVIAQVAPYQRRFREQHGASLVYLADEYYIAAGAPLPPAREYDGFAQYENGIGMARSFIEDWRRLKRRLGSSLRIAPEFRRVSLVCGTLFAPVLRKAASELSALTGAHIAAHVVENSFFGSRVNVSGLLVMGDLERQLRGRDLGDIVVLPRYSLDYSGARFLDDGTPAELQAALGVPIGFASSMRDVLQILREPLESQVAGAGVREGSTNGKAWVDFAGSEAALGGMGLRKEVRR
jgi:putative radical SAM enzyme (TIGR03279 family)